MIVETKGGERNGKSLNIDMQVENKFNAFKEYAERMNTKWGFVRYKDGNLYFNNTTYVEEMSDKNWEPIEKLISEN